MAKHKLRVGYIGTSISSYFAGDTISVRAPLTVWKNWRWNWTLNWSPYMTK